MKKLTAALTAAGMLLTCTIPALPAMAEEQEFVYLGTETIGPLEFWGQSGTPEDAYYIVETCAEDAVEVEIPAEINGYPVVGISAWAFDGCEELTKVVMPDSIVSISFDAFENCEKLADITFSKNLEYVGHEAFEDTAWFENQPDGVIYFGTLAYAYKFSEEDEFTVDLKEGTTTILSNFGNVQFGHTSDDHFLTLNIPASVTEIDIDGGAISPKCMALNVAEENENYASIDGVLFNKEKTDLLVYPMEMEQSSYTIPDGVENIAHRAFQGQGYLKEIVMSDSVETVESAAFMSMINLEKLTLSKNLKRIGENAFAECFFLKQVEFPEGLEYIGQSAFAYCEALKEIHIPASVTEMDSGVFRGCSALESLTVAEDNPRYEMRGDMLYDKQDMILKHCMNLDVMEMIVPEGTKDIDEHTFAGAAFTSVVIPEGVEVIRENVFFYCKNLTTIDLPTTLTKVEELAFDECDALTTINYAGTEEMWNAVEVENFFNDTFLAAKVNFGNQEPVIPEASAGDVNADNAVDATDAAMILVAAAAQGAGSAHGLTDAQAAAADVDGSGSFDATDAALVLQYAAYAGAGGTQTIKEFLAANQ
ncbi:MAG: leucine-rich repeat protein [Oscillospiraceae bacterium]|nr:leucine-rich repeat protein [Oscillospiraceae bacterium]